MGIDLYIKNRIDDQINYYDKKSISYKKWHERISIGTIVVSSLICLIPALVQIFPTHERYLIFLSALLAVVITIGQSIDKLKKFHELYIQFRQTCEKLKQEKFLFQNMAGEYANIDADTIREKLFINRCESIMSTEIGNWAQLNEKKKD